MKIGIITGEYPPMQGGVGDYTQALAYALVQRGVHVSILTDARGTGALPHTLKDLTPVDPLLAINPLIRQWNGYSIRQVQGWVRGGGFNVVNLQFETAAYQMSPWVHFLPLLLRPARVVTTFHDLKVPYLFPKAGPLRTTLVTLLARTSHAAIVTNAADAAALHKRGTRAVHVLPIGSNIPTELPIGFSEAIWRAKITENTSAWVIGYFGFMNESKGVDTLLHAVRLLRDKRHDIHLVFIGGRTGSSDPANAAYAARIEALIVALGLTSFVHWTGFIDPASVSAWLTACDVIALPFLDGASLRRGSLMAALAHGCAIVTTPADPPEPLLAGAVAYTAKSDTVSLAAQIQYLFENPADRRTLEDNARKASHQFAWPFIADQFMSIVNR